MRDADRPDEVPSVVLPDLAPCPACRSELLDPSNRRYRYPFINCAHCGPRASIITGLPYERTRTSMRGFRMCAACRREYEHAHGRRFHAEPNACPICGPQVALWNRAGQRLAMGDAALLAAVGALRGGRVVAVKGSGGFHLVADAAHEAAILELRVRKPLGDKPFAVLYPDLSLVSRHARLSPDEARLLSSPECPILIVDARAESRTALARLVAPGSRQLGVMLPPTPLHLLLLQDFGAPVVVTSGNPPGEPPCIDEREALERLRGLADVFLVHNRPIAHAADDSVVRIACGRELVLRRGRGYAPLPIPVATTTAARIGAGADGRSTVALAAGASVFVSAPIGALDSRSLASTWRQAVSNLESLHGVSATAVTVDADPESESARYGRSLGLPVTVMQHHEAHLAACAADNELAPPIVGAIWDGGGHGWDGTVWGGEFLRANGAAFTRVACLRPFHLPANWPAAHEPRRCALGLLAVCGDAAIERWLRLRPGTFTAPELRALRHATARDTQTMVASSAGRLCDAVASLIGVRQLSAFDGQAAMELEQIIDPVVDGCYPFALGSPEAAWSMGGWLAPALVVDWVPMVEAMLDDLQRGVPASVMAARVHNTMAEMIVRVAVGLGESRLVLSGDCFENRYLLERTVARLRAVGVRPYWPQRLPPNDGAIAVGQAIGTTGTTGTT